MLAKLWMLSLFCFTYGSVDIVNKTIQNRNGTVIGNQILSREDGPYLVSRDLLVAQNATLTIEAGTEVFFIPNVGIRVDGSLHAKGTPSERITFRAIPCKDTIHCNSTNPSRFYNPGIRLVDGTSYNNGRLEYHWNGRWGTVTDRWNNWDYRETKVACRQLGFLGAKRSYYYPGSGPGFTRMSDFSCNGNENSLWDCHYRWRGWGHDYDIGIECDTLIPLLAETVYWKGLHFGPPGNSSKRQGNSSLENTDIVNAFQGIKASKELPNLLNVTVRDGASGLLVKELENHLTIIDSSFLRSRVEGINIESTRGNVLITNVTVQDTKFGDGLLYRRIGEAMDFCSISPGAASFPVVLNAVGNVSQVNCSQVFRAGFGRTISVHFRLIAGSGFQLNVTDVSEQNKTLLSTITDEYNGKTIKTASSSVLELSFYSKGNSRAPANLEMIIVEDQGSHPSLVVSNSNFSNNFKSGITIYNVLGHCQIFSTSVTRNGDVGLNISEAYGQVRVESSMVQNNKKSGVLVDKVSGSMVLQSVRSLKNQGEGISIRAGTVSLVMTDGQLNGNSIHGLFISNQLSTNINISKTQFIRNSGGEGIHLKDFSGDCEVRLADISSLANSQDGAQFERVKAVVLNVTSSSFDGNTLHGLNLNQVFTGNLNLQKISTSNNLKTGIFVSKGGTSVNIESWSSISNHIDGFYLENQQGELRLKDCFVNGNKRNGIWLVDSFEARLQAAHLENCSVLESNRYGLIFDLTFGFRQGSENYTVTVANSTIANNALGGCWFYPSGCQWQLSYTSHRRVQLSFAGNKMEGNQKFGLYIYGPEWYELRAVFTNNDIRNNSGYAMKVAYYDYNCPDQRSFPVDVTVLSNTFIKNRGEYIVFVDYNALPNMRYIVFKNNTFLENRGIQAFFSNYVRTRTQAVLAVKEGTVIAVHNSFVNPLFSHEITTLLRDHERVIQARENWWGTRDECKIKERIFEFGDRVELAQIQYYPFLDSYNTTNVKVYNGSRPFCFLQGKILGGTLNQTVTLPKDSGTYQVTGDIIVLPKGVLIIEGNVILEFPLQAVFIVYGQVIIKGTKKERVRLVPKAPLQKEVRLVGGPSPWNGKLEIWFNNGWMPVCINRYIFEHAIVCRQLGYEANAFHYRYSTGNEKAFVHNVLCDTNENDNVMNCNGNNWISSSSCSGYVVYVECKTPYWAGVHLTITPSKSQMNNLDIKYAGFAYRNDLSIPGIAFRVDLSHHNISGVFVENSAAIGLQMMYPDPFKTSHDITSSIITRTESDGMRLETPFLNLMATNVVNTKGYGFLYYYNWNSLNAHVANIADMSVKKNIFLCSENNTFIDDSSLVYYLVVTTKSSRVCEKVITVPKDYRMGMQLIHHDVNSNIAFHVYSGLNKTSSTLWDIHTLSWGSRPIWKSNSSSILLESSYYYRNYWSTVHFLLFLIKDEDKTELKSANLLISKSSFISNVRGGIYLGGDDSGNIQIQSTVVQESPENGLTTGFSHVNSLTLFNCSFIANKVAIELSSFSGNVNVEDTKISNSTYNALYIISDKQKTVNLLNSSVTHISGYAIYLYGNYEDVRLFAATTFFGWNKATSVYSRIRYNRNRPGISQAVFKNCTFYMNQGPVINIDESPQFYPWKFEGNVFMNNTQSSVIMTTKYTDTRYSPGVFLRKNKFLFNVFQEKAVIDVKGGAKELIIEGNLFEGNQGRSIYVEEQSLSPCTVKNNVFKDNNNSNGGVIEIRRMENEVAIVDNVFKFNEGLVVVLFQFEHELSRDHVIFGNNSLVNNTKVGSMTFACEVNISGLTDYKTISIHHNRFNSYSFSKELCVNVLASYHTSFLNASLNFWGYEDKSDIEERIFDAEDDYERALAVFLPFLDSNGNVIEHSNKNDSFNAHRDLGGRLSSSLHLWSKNSPYTVTSDLTILPDAQLTIHSGVEVQFGSGVAVLVLGSLIVLGDENNPVTFTLLKKNQTDTSIPVRLTGGEFPWIGRLEILQNENWTPVCVNQNTSLETNSAKVACEQLGYQAPSSIDYIYNASTCKGLMSASLSCNGNEKEIDKCSLSFHKLLYNSSRQVVINCTGGTPWGNVRFLREFNTSNPMTSHLQHLKIEHCGEKHGKKVSAIETIQYVPEMNHLSILNCTAGGVKVLFPEREVYLKNVSLVNTGGHGSEVLIAKRNVTLESVTSINNKLGLSFHEPDGHWIDGLAYGQAMPCHPEATVTVVKDRDLFLYHRPPHASYLNLEVRCQMVVNTDGDAGLALQLLVMNNMKYITVEDPYGNEILKYSAKDLGPLSRRRLVPWNTVTVFLDGYYSSEMLLQVQRIEGKDIPCTFERIINSCQWREYAGSYFKNTALTWKWKLRDIYGQHSGIPDHTYSYHGSTGNYMWLGLHWYHGYAASLSPPIFMYSHYCYLQFYYKIRRYGKASLSLFIEELNGNNLTALWSTSTATTLWTKKIIRLPQTSFNYSVVFFGYFENRGAALVDDMEFIHCGWKSLITYHITESIFSGNTEQGISYTSTQTERHLLRIERSKITDNGRGIYLNAANQVFQIFNNYLAENKNDSIYSRFVNQESASNPPVSYIHGNTFESNRGRSLFLQGITGPYLNVKVTKNYFSYNLAVDLDGTVNSVCKLDSLYTLVKGNFFYNNIGQYIVEYSFPGTKVTALFFLNNTLYKNSAMGLNVNYGVTILCNGLAEMHGNVLQNPSNRYQLSTTLQGSEVIINAASNWWGENMPDKIASLIMDRTKDYRLSLAFAFKPFVKLPPQKVVSVSCPPEWIKDNELCFLYKGGSVTFVEAKKYCESYGGNIIAMFSGEDKRLVEDLRKEELILHPTVPPSLWTIGRNFITESNKDSGVCSVVDRSGNITESECDRLHPFVCIRRSVTHCPNGCFHNGDCIGAICFCYPGWTGEDCSQFHCHDLHNCSGNGECMGPNTCKCHPGYLGLGCSYSFCGKYESCSDCVTDPFCGWCDSLQSCLGGFAEGPPKIRCPDWFYYHCYTVGVKNQCSNNIPTVDCKSKQCNLQDGRGSARSCQKCQDLEKCYKVTEEGQCRAWNETRCPGGKVRVDYNDPQRSNSVEVADNVKFVEPNSSVIYACPVILANQEKTSLIFVAPKILDVQVGDILCSPQAGGIMHKIVSEVTDGPFRLMMSTPAGLEEVIKYADFKQEASVEDVDDESTLEDEPNEGDLQDLISGNITVNESRIIVLSSATYKCLGHKYEVGSLLVHSYYLVIEKNLTVPRTGDILVSNTSGGFIETVIGVHQTNDTVYLETKLQRCNGNSQLNGIRLRQSKQRLSNSVFCSGGDNNPGLVLSKAEENDQNFAVNDSIVGRPSYGFIAKVINVNFNGDFLLVEVISATLDGNGTIGTIVNITNLQNHHRRARRSTKNIDLARFQSDNINHKLLSKGNAKLQVSASMYLGLTVFVEIEKKWLGFGIKDASIGLKLKGNMDFSLELSIDGELRYTGSLVVMKERQLGGTKYIRLGMIKLPAGIFLKITGDATAAVSGTLRRSLAVSGGVSLGGECRWSEGSCYTTDNSIYLQSDWNRPKPNLDSGASIDITVTPTLSVKVPAMPKRFGKATKAPSLNVMDKLAVEALDMVDLSLSLYVSVPLKAGISMYHPSSQCHGKTPTELEGYYGISDIVFGVLVGFLEKHLELSLSTGFSRMKWTRDCVCPRSNPQICVGPVPRPPKPRPPIETTPKPPADKKRKKSGNDWNGQGKVPGPPCGTEPACAAQRMGPNCTMPDMRPFQDCFGNGEPIIVPDCKAECNCSGGWEGEYCERISANGGGDPHLETLDGVNFDFFGIGEFWGCKSVHNDFGLQFRFYYYKRASLIGGVALKAGRSVVTIMTIKTENVQDSPIVRIDGILLNITSNSSKPIDINNGTVLLDRQRRFTFESEENSVVLISLEYDSGVTVTIDVRHSLVMKRQYLNVLYSPTAAYKGHTEGLCGFMDNNATNDLMGPDGALYNSAIQFAESWRIKDCHNGSGTFDSWSWNSSNFYHEDIMDLTYTDPSYVPIYSLDGVSQSVLEIATTMCKALNILDNELQSCIFDVAITNDTTFTDQENFKRGCPGQCSGKGRCVNGTCRCIEGWTGDSCDKGSCLNCSTVHGQCVKGFCVCDLGWEGRSCEDKATCHRVNNCTSPVHGLCKTTDNCQCNPGYIGRDCSIIPTCFNVSNCTGNGICVDFDVCKCDVGWTGTNCTQYSCERLDYCSEHGRCVSLDECACNYGWTGVSCALPDCAGVNQCSGKGECVASDLCRCYTGFLGANCSGVADCTELANCSAHGVCVSTKLLNVSCSCFTGFTGANCSQPTCTTVNNCSNHGACIEAELCKCDMGYNGTDCNNFSCEAVNSCSGNGECVGYDICLCNTSWSGPACSIPDCSAVRNCSRQGDCVLPDTCACYPAFDGKYCDKKAQPNTNAPKFDQMFYDATIMENAPVGTMILQVNANDTDLGRNGQVFYAVVGDKDLERTLAIGGSSGKLYSTLILDFESVKDKAFNVTIVASDNGFPQKWGTAIAQITVGDENDNCPTFAEPSGDLELTFSVLEPGDVITKVSAIDLDSGMNGDITYNISKNNAFSIDPKTGVIIVASNLTKTVYQLTVSASDNGVVSCMVETGLTVKIDSLPTKKPWKSSTTSTTKKTTVTTPHETESTSKSPEFTSPKVTFRSTTPRDSSRLPSEATAVPQKSPNYVIIGAATGGGVLVLVIIALIMRKCLCKRRTSSGKRAESMGKVNDCLEGDFELSTVARKI